MRFAALLLLAALAPAHGQIAKTAPTNPEGILRPTKIKPIALSIFTELERRFDNKFLSLGDADSPIELLGATRGVYLDGFGAAFTTEMSLAAAPSLGPFLTAIPKDFAAKVHQRKIDRLPALRQAMRDLMRSTALALAQVPENQQIAIAVRLDYRKWEDTSGLPGQILMRSDRKSAMLGEITSTEEQ